MILQLILFGSSDVFDYERFWCLFTATLAPKNVSLSLTAIRLTTQPG